jgi:hypothetical protein
MGTVIGPVLRRADGYGFDISNAGKEVTRGFPYRRIEDANDARKAELPIGLDRSEESHSPRRSTRRSERLSRQGGLLPVRGCRRGAIWRLNWVYHGVLCV